MSFWERFPASRSEVHDLVVRIDSDVGTSGRLPPAPVRHPRTASYENKHIKKASNELMWIVDDLKSFRARLYDDTPRGALFLGPSFVFLDDVLDSDSSTLDDDEWDFLAMVALGFIPGHYEGKFCVVGYNVDRVARQLGYDQGLASFQTPLFPAGDDLMRDCYRRFVFKPDGPRYCQDLPFHLSVPSSKKPPIFTQS